MGEKLELETQLKALDARLTYVRKMRYERMINLIEEETRLLNQEYEILIQKRDACKKALSHPQDFKADE